MLASLLFLYYIKSKKKNSNWNIIDLVYGKLLKDIDETTCWNLIIIEGYSSVHSYLLHFFL